MEPIPTIFERIGTWIRESVMVKLGSIAFLILILMIPQSSIEDLIRDRESRAESVMTEVASKWSGNQVVTGPALVIPFRRFEKVDKGKDGFEIREWKDKATFLPDQLLIDGKINPETLHRGIFDAVVYGSTLSINATFQAPDFRLLNVNPADALWNEAYLVMGINDLRGISASPLLKIGDINLTGEPTGNVGIVSDYATTDPANRYRDYDAAGETKQAQSNGIIMKLPWTKAEDFVGNTSFKLDLKGSTLLYFSPLGKTTKVNLEGPWPNPSFDGEFLPDPDSKEITNTDFKASWNVLHFNRAFSQQWVGEGSRLTGDFGVKLLIPVDQYQKSFRTAKYGILLILLTFISLFMVEIMKKIRIHPFQYILVGSALIIYYTLLLSFSEHLGYDVAYAIATVATVVLVSLYSMTFLSSRTLVLTFSGLLLFFYGFIFVIIQLQDYSLLLGSIGLFLTIAAIMYFSKGIRWYKEVN